MRTFKICEWYGKLVLLLIVKIVFSQTSQNVNLVGRWAHGPCQAVCADSSLAFIGNGPTFQILNLSDPSAPQMMGELILPELIYKIVVRDNYAYIVSETFGLRIIDVSNYYAPTEVVYYQSQTVIRDIAISGNYAYVAATDSGLRIIDISNPMAVNEISSIYFDGSAGFVEVDGNYAYVSIEWSIRVVDISNPYNPSEIGNIDVWNSRMDISGNYAYVTDRSFTDLHIINISDPANPVEVTSVNTPGYTYNVTVHGQYAYVADGGSGLLVLNVAEPEYPYEVTYYDTPDNAMDVAISGGYVYVADRSSGLQIIKVINPTQEGTLGPFYYPQDVVVSEMYAYVADHLQGLKVIDISDQSSPTQVGSTLTRERALGVTLSGSYAYVASGDSGLTIVNITNPANPTVIGGKDTPGRAVNVTVDGNYAYVSDEFAGLRIFDISNPPNPTEVGYFLTATSVYSVAVRENYAYVVDAVSGLRVLDISNRSNPVEIGFYDTMGDAYDIVLRENIAYVADYYALSVIDISDPFNPSQIAYLNVDDELTDIVIKGDYIFGCGSDLFVFDITNPERPEEVASYSNGSDCVAAQGMFVYEVNGIVGFEIISLINPIESGFYHTAYQASNIITNENLAYVSEANSGMHILNIADPASPYEISYFDTPGAVYEIAIQGIYAYVADNTSFRIINISDPSNPQETGFVEVYANDLALYGNYAYAASGGNIEIINIANPSNPTSVGTYTTYYVNDIAIKDNYAFLACGSAGFRILNLSNPTNPVETGFNITADNAYSVAISGNYAYVADYDVLLIFDISNPTNPVEAGSLTVSCRQIAINGDYACVSHDFYFDFQIIDVSNPENPQIVGQYDDGFGARGMTISGPHVYLTHGPEGVYILQETIPPFPPTNLTAGGSSPSPWQNNPDFLLNWGNPGDMSGISQAKYKIGNQPPAANNDFNALLPATSPQTITVSQEGSRSLYLWLVDNAGNEDYQNFSTVQVRYDASISPPTNVSENHGVISDTWQNSVNNPTFSWNEPADLSGISKYYLYFGSDPSGNEIIDSTSNTSYSFSGSEGISYFRIRVKDNAENMSEWTTAFIFKYDNTIPTNPGLATEIGGTISDIWQGDVSDPNFTWSGASDPLSGIAQYHVYWGTNAEGIPSVITSTPAYNPNASTNNIYYLRVNVEDRAGNRSPNKTLFVFKHDALPPENPTVFNDIVGSENGVWQNSVNDPNFSWDTGNDPLSGIQGYKYYWGRNVNGVSENMVSSPGYNPAPVDTGIWYLRISAVDWVGNSTIWFTGYTFEFDNVAPEASATSDDTSGYTSFTVTWLNGNDRGGSGLAGYDVWVRDEGGVWTEWLTDTTSTNAVYDGEHGHTYYFEVAAKDHAGNTENFKGIAESFTVVDTLTTDVQPPGPPVALTAGGYNPSPWQNTPQFELDWTNPQDENGIARGYYKLNAIPISNSDYTGVVSGEPPHLVSATQQGGQELYLWLEDGRGNVNFQNYAMATLRYDGTRPTNSVASSPDTTVYETFTVTWSGASDNGGSGLSGRYNIRVKEDQGAWSNWLTDTLCMSANYTGKQGHTYYFESLAIDNAGNIEQFSGVEECSTYIAARLILSLSQIQGEQSDQVVIEYNIFNNDNNLTDINCQYRLSSNLPWNPATITGITTGIQPEDYQGTITWDSYADAPGVDLTSVSFKITPSDFNGSGLADSTGMFHLDNNRIPSVSIYSLNGEQSGDILIFYQLSDQELDTIQIFCEFSSPLSQSWLTATTTGDLTGLINYSGSVTWNSKEDVPEAAGSYQFRIRPKDIDFGISDTTIFFVDNVGAPDILSISDLTEDEQNGNINIYYTLSDDEGDNISLVCKYSENSGLNWDKASVSGGVSNISPANYQGSLIWNSDDDLPGIDKNTIRFQITPSDGNLGFPMETADFHLDNNSLPSVQISSISSSQSGIILLPVVIQDTEKDTIQISGKSQIGTGAWKNITFSGKTQFSSSDYINVLEWNSVKDIGFGELKTVRVQLIPIDNDSGTVSVSNIFDVYNYAGDYTADLKINFSDLIIFAKAWSEQDLTKEIGPAEGKPPLLIPKPDNLFDFEDLMVLVQQWNWSYDHADSLTKGNLLSKATKQNNVNSEVLLKTLVDEKKTRYVWEKKINLSDRIIHVSPLNKHLVNVSQPNYDLWSHEFGDELTFTMDSTAMVLGVELELDFDPQVFTVSAIDNFLLREQTGITFKNTNSEAGKLILNTVVLEKKENLIKNEQSLFQIKINPLQEKQTPISYRWKIYDTAGRIISQGSKELQLNIHYTIPKKYALYQNFPNPFNPSTTIRYQLPEESKVQLEIFNILGERIITLVNQSQKAGYYSQNWDISQSLSGIASGLYFVRLIAMGKDNHHFVDHKKVIVLK